MIDALHLHLEILPPPQRRLWDELACVPETFALYGGTAVALHLGHRVSLDFDLFGSHPFDPDHLYRALPILQDAEVLQKSSDTLTCLVHRGGEVRISFFGVPELGRIDDPLVAPDNGLRVAALRDLAGTKTAVVQKRAAAKDYLDLDAILSRGGVDLATALAASRQIYGNAFNPQITLKALSFFGDGDLTTLPPEVCRRLSRAVRAVDLDRLPSLERLR